MKYPGMRARKSARALLALTAVATPWLAHAETYGTIDVSAQGTAASNPFLRTGGDTEAVAAGIQIDPSIVFDDVTAKATLSGSLRLDQFSNSYGTDAAGRLRFGVVQSLDERTSISSSASFQTSRSAVRDLFATGLSEPGDPLAEPDVFPPDLEIPDVSSAGLRSRTTTLWGSSSLTRALGPRDSLSLGISAGLTRSEAEVGGDYQRWGVFGTFGRRLSERTQVYLSADAGFADYKDAAQGDGRYITPVIGVEHQFSDTLAAHAEIGASFADVEGPGGSDVQRTTLAGEASICQRYARSSLCAGVSRRAQPTAFGGITSTTAASLTYGVQVNENDRFSLQSSYGRSDRNVSGLAGNVDKQDVVSASADYRHRFAERLFAFVNPRFEKIFPGATGTGRSNVEVMVGITYRFGRAR